MSYPKPLSEKSLKRLYTQARLSTEACDFLHSLFAAAANLYGAIALRDVWSVYRELKSEAPRIRRQDLVAFSAIVRREVQPYRVYEIEELYTEEPHNNLDRHTVRRNLWHRLWQDVFLLCVWKTRRFIRTVFRQFPLLCGAVATAEEKITADFIGNLEPPQRNVRQDSAKRIPTKIAGKSWGRFRSSI